MNKALFIVVLFVFSTPVLARTTRVKIEDENGAPIAGVLTIVMSLERHYEFGRYLTDKDGLTPAIQIDDGVFRVIATFPYSGWKTRLQEYVGASVPAEIAIRLSPLGSDQYGVQVGNAKAKVIMDKATVHPQGISILVRDSLARWESWHVTDKDGAVEIELVDDPTVVVVVYGGKIFTEYVSDCHPIAGLGSGIATSGPVLPCKTVTIKLDQNQP